MMRLPTDASDDPEFVDLATRAIRGDAALVSAEFLHVVKIDSWFGDRWFGFAGKALGALGVHDRNLKVPPFHPHRVVSETRFRLADPPEQVAVTAPLHYQRSSESNLNYSVMLVGESTTVGWFSGDSAVSGRGALMVYSCTAHGAVGWYAGLERRGGWRLVTLVGAGPRQWETLLRDQPAAH